MGYRSNFSHFSLGVLWLSIYLSCHHLFFFFLSKALSSLFVVVIIITSLQSCLVIDLTKYFTVLVESCESPGRLWKYINASPAPKVSGPIGVRQGMNINSFKAWSWLWCITRVQNHWWKCFMEVFLWPYFSCPAFNNFYFFFKSTWSYFITPVLV